MELTPDLYLSQCKRRFGEHNPERVKIPLWESMIRTGLDPSSLRRTLGLPWNGYGDPDWSFIRCGMSRTPMPDGRIICIAGEHEDFYDPDFCIYNDVVVLKPAPGQEALTQESGEVEIHTYPEALFPPTDFHSATLVGDRIILIGRLGYHGARLTHETPLMAINTVNYEASSLPSSGIAPGWIYKHHAALDAARHTITVRGGNRYVAETDTIAANFGAHRLHLADMKWEELNPLEHHREFLISETHAGSRAVADLDTPSVWRPQSVPHQQLPRCDWDFGGCHRLDVEGVRVTFNDWVNEIRVVIEGELPQDVVNALLADLLQGIQERCGFPWTVREVALSPPR